jgi:hypothetical protein
VRPRSHFQFLPFDWPRRNYIARSAFLRIHAFDCVSPFPNQHKHSSGYCPPGRTSRSFFEAYVRISCHVSTTRKSRYLNGRHLGERTWRVQQFISPPCTKRPLSRLHPPLIYQLLPKTSTNVFLSALLAHDCLGLKWSLSRRSHTARRFVSFSDKHFPNIDTLFLVSMRRIFATQFYTLRNKMCSMRKDVPFALLSHLLFYFHSLSGGCLVQFTSSILFVRNGNEAFNAGSLSVFQLFQTRRPWVVIVDSTVLLAPTLVATCMPARSLWPAV